MGFGAYEHGGRVSLLRHHCRLRLDYVPLQPAFPMSFIQVSVRRGHRHWGRGVSIKRYVQAEGRNDLASSTTRFSTTFVDGRRVWKA